METKVKKEIREVAKEDLEILMNDIKEPAFRVKQLIEWLWLKNARTFESMTNLSKNLRDELALRYDFRALTVNKTQISADGTIKIRFETFDHHFIEGVLIPSTDRLTACISSQIGCSLTCKFCATGKMERVRNLTFYEIYDQVAFLQELSEKHFQKRLSNLVFMGMGEPLLNYNHVLRAIDKITAPKGMGMSPSRITVSTSGIAKQIKQLADDKVKFNLALSLHAADNVKRGKMMPINDSNKLEDLIEALDYFYKETHSPITYEYILFNGVNDSDLDAENLIKLCRRVPSKVNLIEYNTVDGTGFSKPSHEVMDHFIVLLQKAKVNVRVRRSRGKDIDAACGQLANKG
jgi:23S rRNA (adenine2503-C2)-methyltransferase